MQDKPTCRLFVCPASAPNRNIDVSGWIFPVSIIFRACINTLKKKKKSQQQILIKIQRIFRRDCNTGVLMVNIL